MPIKIANGLPAQKSLESENVFVMTEDRAIAQDIRPLNILILNLMPTKIETETQLLRLLSNSPLQIEVELLQVKSHKSKNTSQEHMLKFYKTFDEICDKKYDGFIVTGAPVENMAFEEVDYWDELCGIFEWSKKNVYSTFHICWGAQAALYYHYGIPKYSLDEKFYVPHSRHTETRMKDIALVKDLQIISYSEQAGVHLISDMDCRNFFATGHSEYDRETLAKEYFRDINKGLDIKVPFNYFPDDDPNMLPPITWRGTANLLFTNWLNYFVYQRTPYDLSTL